MKRKDWFRMSFSRESSILSMLSLITLLCMGFNQALASQPPGNNGAKVMTNYVEIVNGVMAAWKKDDIEGVLARLDEDIEYHYFVGRKPLLGKSAVRQFLQTFGQGQTQKRWRINNYAINGDKMLVEGVDDYVAKDGTRVQLVYMGIFEFRDGLIYRWRDYVDTAMAENAKAGKVPPDYIKALIDKR